MLDLHIHSTFSDGTETPEALVFAAKSAKVTAIALCDHDTTAGCADFLNACHAQNQTGISAIEMSVSVETGEMHILGLGVDPASEILANGLDEVVQGRIERNFRILERLNELDIPLTYEEVSELAGNEIVARPHFAEAMLSRGFVGSISEAFERFLGKGAPAYVERYRLHPKDAIEVINRAGGIAVLAHPTSITDNLTELEETIKELTKMGLAGIEAYYPSHSPDVTLELLRFAIRYSLLPTGGSDFHGESIRPGIHIGTGSGSLFVADKFLPPILEKISKEGCYIAS